jgi:SAM-dependent methyltransferase
MTISRQTLSLFPALVALALATAALAQETRAPDVIFVATDEGVVEDMLRMAKVSRGDLVYDLGCGDGRLVITAAKRYGARGVGIDIDPKRIEESKQNAAKEGVADRVKFILGDLFQADFHDATVVTLYLLPELNLKLRPILMKQLKPGTPVVSHDYHMGDWEPDEVRAIADSTRSHIVYLWRVPANVAGVWRWNSGDGLPQALTIQQKFQKLTAILRTKAEERAVADIRLLGDQISFRDPGTGRRFTGRASADSIEGSVTEPGGSPARPWLARKAVAAAGKTAP